MCGLFGVFNHKEASKMIYLGLYSLQHRGQESAGIVTYDGKQAFSERGMGLVSDVFNEEKLNALKGATGIGHTRYSTTGSSVLKNAQPFIIEHAGGFLAVAHNGNLTNTRALRNKLEAEGSIFQTTMDSEIVVHLIVKSKKKNIEDKIADALSQVEGAYSFLFLTENELIAARDPRGFKPLGLAKCHGGYALASETSAFDITQAEYIREVEPGEIVVINKNGIRSLNPFPEIRHAFCIFEYIYFAKPDSNIYGENVYLARKALGRQLARELPAKADMVLPIPDSGNYAALGYAEESKIPFEIGIIRNHYVGRTFIQPLQKMRDFSVKLKLNPTRQLIRNKDIIVVEDSIVRGTTSRSRMRTLREAGARKIHMRVSCPPIKYPCYFGIDFPTRNELVAASNEPNEIAKIIGADSLGYISLEGMLKSMPIKGSEFCTSCFTGKYPVKPPEGTTKSVLEKKQ
ncbi:MAG: amidophosphoribosyltransferase [Elusimicrobia bacterium RIFOXYB2_FULL_48_7]|nr:MAG: amidophosphoribosyltransferase [Elusimicrobia bacterium RIFOXYB2_FULL_48_7]